MSIRKRGQKPPDVSFAAVAEKALDLLWCGDAEGKCIYLNRALREFWGVAEADVAHFDWSTTLLAEDAEKVMVPFIKGLRERAPFTCEARYRRADGAIRLLETHSGPCFDRDGAFVGVAGIHIDVTDARDAEARLRESEARLRALADNLPYGMVFQLTGDERRRRFSFVSNRCEALNGVTAEQAIADPSALYNLIAPDYREAFLEAEQKAYAEMSHFEFDAPMQRENGEARWFRIASAPRRIETGEIVWDGVQVDIHQIKMADERRRLLMSEMSHRIKNLLSTVISIAVQTGRTAPSVAEFNASFQSRLLALSRSHDLLLRDAADTADLREILEKELRPYADPSSGRGLTLTGDPVSLAGAAALNFALVVHEMATNAAKYGAYSAAGSLDVAWTVERSAPGAPVTLIWAEQGGPPVTAPARKGFGSRLINAILASDLAGGAELDFAPSGLRARLSFRTS